MDREFEKEIVKCSEVCACGNKNFKETIIDWIRDIQDYLMLLTDLSSN